MNCYLQVVGRNWIQEHYETASGDARKRAIQLRKAGFQAKSHGLGPQVTNVGIIKMTMVDIRFNDNQDITNLPTDNWTYQGI